MQKYSHCALCYPKFIYYAESSLSADINLESTDLTAFKLAPRFYVYFSGFQKLTIF